MKCSNIQKRCFPLVKWCTRISYQMIWFIIVIYPYIHWIFKSCVGVLPPFPAIYVQHFQIYTIDRLFNTLVSGPGTYAEPVSPVRILAQMRNYYQISYVFDQNWRFSSNQLYFHHVVLAEIQSCVRPWSGHTLTGKLHSHWLIGLLIIMLSYIFKL